MKINKVYQLAIAIVFILAAFIFLVCIISSCAQKTHVHKSGYYVVDSVLVKENGTTTVKLKGITRPVLFLSDTIKVNDTLNLKRLKVYSKKVNAYNL